MRRFSDTSLACDAGARGVFAYLANATGCSSNDYSQSVLLLVSLLCIISRSFLPDFPGVWGGEVRGR